MALDVIDIDQSKQAIEPIRPREPDGNVPVYVHEDILTWKLLDQALL
jgi:hypothetical protein